MNNIIILGAGESGLGSALLAKRNKYDVFVSDSSKISDQVKNKLVELEIDFEENSHQKAKTLKPDFIVKSPGISDANDIDVVIFDCELTPNQQKELRALFKCDVVDRTGLILDIFALHAQSKEATLQLSLIHISEPTRPY